MNGEQEDHDRYFEEAQGLAQKEVAPPTPELTQEEVVMVLRFLTEPDRLQLHGHESRAHVALVDKLIAIARSLGVTINEGTG